MSCKPNKWLVFSLVECVESEEKEWAKLQDSFAVVRFRKGELIFCGMKNSEVRSTLERFYLVRERNYRKT